MWGNILTVCYPVQSGQIKNFDDYEKMLHESFYNTLRVCPEEHPVALLLSPNVDATQRSKVVQIMFETFNVPAFAYSTSDLAVSCGRDALVVGMGHNACVVSAVVGGKSVGPSVVTVAGGGEAVTEQLVKSIECSEKLAPELLEEIKVRRFASLFVASFSHWHSQSCVL